MSLEHRLNQAIDSHVKTDNEKLYDNYMEGKRLEREGKRICDQVRTEIGNAMENGELVGYSDAYLSLQERTTYDINQNKASEVLTQGIWIRAAEVTPKKVKALLDAEIITQAEFDQIATPVTSYSLVTKTTR